MQNAFSRPIHAGFVLLAFIALFGASCGKRTARAKTPAAPVRIGSEETGIASWYGVPYHGRRTASGEVYDMEQLTAAHRELPFQTWVEVTNLENGKRVDVRITDRGPFVRGRIIDLSHAAARDIELLGPGIARVRLTVIPPPREAPTSVLAKSAAPPVPVKSSASPVTATMSGVTPGSTSVAAKIAQAPSLDPPMEGTTLAAASAAEPAKPNGATSLLQPGGPNAEVATRAVPSAALHYVVQAGAFADRDRAESLRAAMVEAFGEARAILDSSRTPSLWKVLVGRDLTIEQANELAARVRARTKAALIATDPEPSNPAGLAPSPAN